MRSVTLPGTDLTTSRLGFGSTGGRISDRERLRLYEAAFDHGITHFDTARAYGLGAAEAVLGKFLVRRRDEVTITTKLGIVPPNSGPFLRAAKRTARTVERLLPSAGARAKQVAGNRLLTGRRFSVDEARASLETSLRELRTDYVDIVLLHECAESDLSEDLMTYLDARIHAGDVRFTGIATGPEDTASIMASNFDFPRVIQVANSVTEPNLERLSVGSRATITHSPFRAGFTRLREALASSPDSRERWVSELRTDYSEEALLTLMLLYSLRANRTGIVLFYSQREGHIVTDAMTASRAPAFSDEQVAAFARLVREEGASP